MTACIRICQNGDLLLRRNAVVNTFAVLVFDGALKNVSRIQMLNRLMGFNSWALCHRLNKSDRSVKFHAITSILNFVFPPFGGLGI